jgi:hypothetical protein
MKLPSVIIENLKTRIGWAALPLKNVIAALEEMEALAAILSNAETRGLED